MVRSALTQERLQELLNYNPLTGLFTWKVNRKQVKIGDIAGTVMSNGYVRIKVDNVKYKAHRLVFLFELGYIPDSDVDHIDGDRKNNRRTNLRLCTKGENNCNTKLRKDNSTGVKGVTIHRPSGKYKARVSVNGKQIYLGLYEDLELAELVATEARAKYHGRFARNLKDD